MFTSNDRDNDEKLSVNCASEWFRTAGGLMIVLPFS